MVGPGCGLLLVGSRRAAILSRPGLTTKPPATARSALGRCAKPDTLSRIGPAALRYAGHSAAAYLQSCMLWASGRPSAGASFAWDNASVGASRLLAFGLRLADPTHSGWPSEPSASGDCRGLLLVGDLPYRFAV